MSDVETRSSCSSDSLTASDLSESAPDRDTKVHTILEAHSAIAAQAGHVSRFTEDPLTAVMHLKLVADMLRLYDMKYVSSPSRDSALIAYSPPGADKFLRESFIAIRRLWMSNTMQRSTLEMSLWKLTGNAKTGVVVSDNILEQFIIFVLKIVRNHDTCDSVVETGFDLVDTITRSRYDESDRDAMHSAVGVSKDASHFSFSDAALKELMAAAFGEKEPLSESRPATALRATQTLSAYIKRGSSDPPVVERTHCMLRAGILEQLIRHICKLCEPRVHCKGERRESGASDGTLSSYSCRFSIESVGHADGEEHRVRRADVRATPLDDKRLHACLALLNNVLRTAAPDTFGATPDSNRETIMTDFSVASRDVLCHDGDVKRRRLFTANEKRKMLEAMTSMSHYRLQCGACDAHKARVAISMARDALSGWRLYVSDHCLSSRRADPFNKAYDDDRSRRRLPAEKLTSTETFYRRAPAFDARLAAADVGLALRDAAKLFEVFGAETGCARWFDEVERLVPDPETERESARHLMDLTVLATSRGFFSVGSSLHWHTMCAHAGAVLHAATLACHSPEDDTRADSTTAGVALGTPDLLLAAAELEERCRGTCHASLARSAASILASTNARMLERRARGRRRALDLEDAARRPPRVGPPSAKRRRPRERFRVTEGKDGARFYELV